MKLKYDDGKHAYWLDGKRCKGVTSVAKTLDDTFALDQWRKRQVAIGMAVSPPLVERAAAHFDDRDQLNRIAEEAMAAAKSHDAAERGTATHRITERHDLGLEIVDTPYSRAVRRAWDMALAKAGLEVVPEYVERVVVLPEQRICGTFDRLLRNKRTRKLVVADLKTGSVRYPHAMAVQLGIYANAPLIASKLPAGGGVTEDFEKFPDVDKRWGFIVHMPNPDTVEVHKIDVHAGWQAARSIIFPLLKWRDRRDLIKPLAALDVGDPTTPASDERTAWISSRIQLLGASERARELVVARGPNGVTPRGPWSDVDVDALDEMLRSVERDVSASFPEPDPALV